MQSPETMKRLREQNFEQVQDEKKLISVGADKLFRLNNEEEEQCMYKDYMENGWGAALAKANMLIAAGDAAREARSARRLALRATKKPAQEAVKKMPAEERSM